MAKPGTFKLILFAFLAPFLFTACTPALHLLVRDGLVYDGTGAPAYRADIGIISDSIAFVGDSRALKLKAKRVVDASGYLVTPGFIDPHTHVDLDLFHPERRALLSHMYQGVTTLVVGSDGEGTVAAGFLLNRLDSSGVGVNVGAFIGHNGLRRAVMGVSDEAPTEAQMEEMKALLARGMADGVLGLSAGLFYTPGSFAETEEVIELAKEAARAGGIYDVHLRDESSYNIGLLAAVDETILIAEEAGIPANIAHIKALGTDVWGQSGAVIARIESARARGLRITADQYPYQASSTGLHAALLPRWVFADDPDYHNKLNDSLLLPEIRAGMAENLQRRGGAGAILLSLPERVEEVRGKTLEEVAAAWAVSPVEAALRVMRNGSSKIVSFNMTEDDILAFMEQPWVMTSSDGGAGHPRKYGSFPRKIKTFVLEKQAISLGEMIHRSTLLTAQTFGIPRRGRLAPGFFADLIVFRPEEVRDVADFENPFEYATGMHYVIVNGQVAIGKGQYTGKLAGRAVRRRGMRH